MNVRHECKDEPRFLTLGDLEHGDLFTAVLSQSFGRETFMRTRFMMSSNEHIWAVNTGRAHVLTSFSSGIHVTQLNGEFVCTNEVTEIPA